MLINFTYSQLEWLHSREFGCCSGRLVAMLLLQLVDYLPLSLLVVNRHLEPNGQWIHWSPQKLVCPSPQRMEQTQNWPIADKITTDNESNKQHLFPHSTADASNQQPTSLTCNTHLFGEQFLSRTGSNEASPLALLLAILCSVASCKTWTPISTISLLHMLTPCYLSVFGFCPIIAYLCRLVCKNLRLSLLAMVE